MSDDMTTTSHDRALGQLVAGRFVQRDLDTIFAHRRLKTRQILIDESPEPQPLEEAI